GSFVNAEGRWQSFDAAANLVGEARPAWRILRVLGNQLGVTDFEYQSVAEVCEAAREEIGDCPADNSYAGQYGIDLAELDAAPPDLDVSIYAVDGLVRRSAPLQATPQAGGEAAHASSEAKSA
ncbi:MAG: NADH-quinone oxidoreductase subunit G, partial [Alphaproteobacteria bacterium]|nr:NADH-quinone oxidoreductase subunit G [Alphaproteobacteria bacterium]